MFLNGLAKGKERNSTKCSKFNEQLWFKFGNQQLCEGNMTFPRIAPRNLLFIFAFERSIFKNMPSILLVHSISLDIF